MDRTELERQVRAETRERVQDLLGQPLGVSLCSIYAVGVAALTVWLGRSGEQSAVIVAGVTCLGLVSIPALLYWLCVWIPAWKRRALALNEQLRQLTEEPAGIMRSLRAIPSQACVEGTSLADLVKKLGGRARDWSMPEQIGEPLCPRNADGTVYGQRWMVSGYGTSSSAAKELCRELVSRGLMVTDKRPHYRLEISMQGGIPLFDHYKWSDEGLRLYEYAMSEKA